MNIQEVNYRDYLLTLTSAFNGQVLVASSWNRIVNNIPSTNSSELDYASYYNSLDEVSKEDSSYDIFSSLWDIIDPTEQEYQTYEIAMGFENLSLSICKKRKEPAK